MTISLLSEISIFGYPLSSFAWKYAWVVIAVFLATFGLAYYLVVWLFGRMNMTREQRSKATDLTKQWKQLTREQRKTELAAQPAAVRNVVSWDVSAKKVATPIVAVVLVIAILATAVFVPYGALIWKTLFPKKLEIDTSEQAKLAAGAARDNIVTIEREGAVLVQNNGALPLDPTKDSQKKLNIFGSCAFGMLYGGGGSGVFVTNRKEAFGKDLSAVKLETALTEVGFEYNKKLYNLVANYYESKKYSIADTDYNISCQYNVYNANGAAFGGGNVLDPSCVPTDYEPEAEAYKRTYSGLPDGKTLLEDAKDYSDVAIFCVTRSGAEDGELSYGQLQLTVREQEVLEMIRDNFGTVVLLINSSNVMELSIAEQKSDNGNDIDAVLWVGHPGLSGNKAVAEIIAGITNPSGKLVDTWARDLSSEQSFVNFGDNTNYFTSGSNAGQAFQIYYEGIYVGYRYYTTRAMTDPTFDYDSNVLWSFGHGLSYTTFDKYINDYRIDEKNGTIEADIAFTNTGDVKGREVGEIYFTAPYENGGPEKAYYELAAFVKTNDIEAGETQVYTVSFDIRDMSSWDTRANNGEGAYVLSKGEYKITLRDNAWKQSESPSGSTEFAYNVPADVVYATDDKTGETVQNRFTDVEYGPYSQQVTYLSRSDWDATFTSADQIVKVASSNAVNVDRKSKYQDNQYDPDGIGYNFTPVDNGLTIFDLKDADWDDERWNLLLDQMSLRDMANLIDNGDFQTVEVKSIGKELTYDDDGPAMFSLKSTGHCSEVVIASTWNPNCALLLGESVGKEGATIGGTGWYAPGINIHRSAMGGRNFEYYSEDPLISGIMGAKTAEGTMKYGVYTYAKHFVLNDQETERRGIQVWTNEQALREIYLKPFELYVKSGYGLGIMSSFNRIGNCWTGGSEALCTDVLRTEWGFHGVVVTDYMEPNIMKMSLGLRAQNDLCLHRNTLNDAYSVYLEANYDGAYLMRRACKNILYAIAHSNSVWSEEDYAAVELEKPDRPHYNQ